MPLIRIGSPAPDFTLKDQHNREFRLSDLRGKKVLLSWHPLAFTKVCARQMQSLEKHWAAFGKLNTVAVGISVDTVPSKHAWAKAIKVRNLRMLSDFWPHGATARKYGIFRREGFSERANVVVDERGRVAWARVYPIKELPDIDEVLAVLEL
ncbi:redoxin domain-containing protein [bacterium]|nr:redoxin domain-containing protein [bacterium]